jgi:2-oxoglutarate dehydrogenase E2 component (dihydrolipoamide succinyltransferase)
MLTVTSGNLRRSLLRSINNYLEKCATEVPSKHRAYHQGIRAIRKATISSSNSALGRPQSICCKEVRYFRSSAALFDDTKIVNVPPFADSVSEGDVRWEKKKGDHVAEDEVVLEIETDKTSVPVPSPAHGIIEETFVEDGATVKAGQKLFKLKVTGAAPEKAAAPAAKPVEAPAAAPPPPPPAAAPPKPAGKRILTPASSVTILNHNFQELHCILKTTKKQIISCQILKNIFIVNNDL